MADCLDGEKQFYHLYAAAQTRSRAIQTKLSLALTFCSVAETELDYGRVAQAQKLLQIVRESVGSVKRHLDKPKYL